MLLLKRSAPVALLYRFLMTWIRLVLHHGCPKSCKPNPVEDLLEVYEDMIEVLPVLEIFLTDDS